MFKERLFTPGPVSVPPTVMVEMARPFPYHRGSEFADLLDEIEQGLRYLFQTMREVLVFSASGTGAMEAAVVNLLSRREKALVIRGGKFGERWGEICSAYGVEVVPLNVEWGTAVDPDAVRRMMASVPNIRAVFATQSETSTGVLHDIQGIAEAMKGEDALLIVDAISGLGAHPMLFDEWGIDVAVTGSQKCLMLPPGLSFVALSERAWGRVETSDLPKYYWSFLKARKAQAKGQTPYTPAITLMVGLRKSLTLLRSEGLEALWARHARHAEATRRAVEALGLPLFTRHPSNVLTIFTVPEGIDGKSFLRHLRTTYGMIAAGGQEQLAGRVIRISHLGDLDDLDVIGVVSVLEMALRDVGWQFEVGAGVGAAQKSLMITKEGID
ncbi:MAG: alanine--glyoxylate aminotransferase family protein [Candidatus Latescibacteria bacterium]|nr:alanine--glyoxylate aminotransferase family protein [Candidatus Latescibacterota bacterium]